MRTLLIIVFISICNIGASQNALQLKSKSDSSTRIIKQGTSIYYKTKDQKTIDFKQGYLREIKKNSVVLNKIDIPPPPEIMISDFNRIRKITLSHAVARTGGVALFLLALSPPMNEIMNNEAVAISLLMSCLLPWFITGKEYDLENDWELGVIEISKKNKRVTRHRF